jgi:GrpB-like predicted nucleotidyltransferase (UPF0157 family)
MNRGDDPLLIQDYDPSWPHTFSKLAARIQATLGSLVVAVEHIGSTAVSGLAAKPIVDLDVVLGSAGDLPEAVHALASLGYVDEGDLGIAGRQALRSPAGEPRHHLYVLILGADELARHLAFRDALRSANNLRDRYAALKRSLADNYPNDRSAYTQGKAAFVTSVVSHQIQPTDAVAPLRGRLSADLLIAMKARDKPAIDTLRCLLAALDNAGAQDPKAFGSSTEVPRKSLTEDEVQTVMKTEITSRRAAVIDYERGGRHRDAARLRAELVLVARYISP